MNKEEFKKLANSFYDDLNKELEDPKFRKGFYENLLKLQVADEMVRLRKKLGITQKELADRIKTTQAVISRIETAQVFASTEIIQRICSEFGVGVSFKFEMAVNDKIKVK